MNENWHQVRQQIDYGLAQERAQAAARQRRAWVARQQQFQEQAHRFSRQLQCLFMKWARAGYQ